MTRIEKHEPKAGCSIRTDAVHLYGVDNLQTSQILHYFGEYAPSHVEWINDSSCNVVWSGDDLTPKRALLSMGIPVHINRIGGNPASGHHYTLVKMNSPSDPFDLLWRAGPCLPGTVFRLIMRFATSCDSTKIDVAKGVYDSSSGIRISTNNRVPSGVPRAPQEFELLYGFNPSFDSDHGDIRRPSNLSSHSQHSVASHLDLDYHRNFEKSRFDADAHLDYDSNLVNNNNSLRGDGNPPPPPPPPRPLHHHQQQQQQVDDISSIYMEIDKYKRRSKFRSDDYN